MIGNSIEVLEYAGDGYSKVMSYGAWRVAIINYAERFDERNLTRLERHLLTDEVFVLLEGNATLISDGEKYPMEKGKMYNVKAGTWHAIAVSRDAKVLIVENDDTCIDNTEYKQIN